MTFLHSGLLLALALTAVPVVLHLLLKQKPKRIDFPALRLVQSRKKRSTKRLRLRHLLLLMLRVLLIAGIVFAAARPLLPAADWSFRWWDGAIAAGLITAGAFAQRWLSQKAAATPAQATREQLQKRGTLGIWSALSLIGLLTIFIPYAMRVSASMKEAPTAESLDLPVAGVFVFDVSASMSYQQGGRTLLDAGREIVAEHVGALPSGSRVAVTDNATDQAILFQVALSSVPAQLERLHTEAAARPLNSAIAAAFDAHRDDQDRIQSEGDSRDRFVRRVYVVTDLAKSAWTFPDSSGLADFAGGEESPGLFVLDVGVLDPKNRGLTDVRLSTEELPKGGFLTVRSTFQTTNDETVSAELYLAESGEPARVGAQDVDTDGQSLTFAPTMSVESDAVEGKVALEGTDPLAIDDVRYFTVGVTPLPNVLIVSEKINGAFADTFELTLALTGDNGATAASMYDLETIESVTFSKESLQGQDVVCLVNVKRLTDAQWQLLDDFVRAGGGLAVFLGSDQIESFSYNRAATEDLLPAKLDVPLSWPERDQARLLFAKREGPFVDRITAFDSALETIETTRVRRYWRVQPHPDAAVVARYTKDALPALVSRSVGQGVVMMLATGIDLKKVNERWSNLMLLDNTNYWAGILFCDQLMRHLARVGKARRNFVSGEIPIVTLPESAAGQKLLLQTPDLRNLPLDPTNDKTLAISKAVLPGHYRLTAGGKRIAAFSVNYPVAESQLGRATESDLASLFGDDVVELARSLDELNEEIDVARFGQEAFPMLLLLAIAFFAGETLLSSRFYGDSAKPGTLGRRLVPMPAASSSERATSPAETTNRSEATTKL